MIVAFVVELLLLAQALRYALWYDILETLTLSIAFGVALYYQTLKARWLLHSSYAAFFAITILFKTTVMTVLPPMQAM